jgi:hypothetical protein
LLFDLATDPGERTDIARIYTHAETLLEHFRQ